MNKFILSFILVFVCTFLSFGQVEIKANPLGLVLKNIDIGAEYGISQNIGLGLQPIIDFDRIRLFGETYKSARFGAILQGKYYFIPKKRIDNIYGMLYLKPIAGNYALENIYSINAVKISMGIGFGYKFVSTNHIVFESNFGYGRALFNKAYPKIATIDLSTYPYINYDFILSVMMGYRF